jgi:hypothetical protein
MQAPLALMFPDASHPAALEGWPAALAAVGVDSLMLGDDWASDSEGRLLEDLAVRTHDRTRVICIGLGSGGYGALCYGRLLGAETILVAAPGFDPVHDAAALDDLAALFEDPDLTIERQRVCILAATDGPGAEEALAERLRRAGANVDFSPTGLPGSAISTALIQSSRLASCLGLPGAAPAAHGEDLAGAWRRAFAHGWALDLAAAYQDVAGALHLSGRFANRSEQVLDLGAASALRIRIGVRVHRGGAEGPVIQEVRAGFANTRLAPGEAFAFQATLPDFDLDAPSAIGCALVCEGRFWFDDLGFPAVKALTAPPVEAEPAL